MSISLRLLSTIALLGTAFWACAPDLDALSSKYDPATGGSSGSGGSSGKPSTGGSGGTSHPGTGGTGGISGTGGDGTGGTIEAGAAGQAGEDTGATGGTGGSMVTPDSCDNGVKDSNETGVDCGGNNQCPRCDIRGGCNYDSDCQSAFCYKGHCATPTCSDNVKNQGETGVDCGGPCSQQGFTCDDGVACASNDDCTGEFCSSKVCTDHCTSKSTEADETDVDCGGKQCSPCKDNKTCIKPTDCQSGVCNNNKCVPATCSDNITNQDESDKDCGGTCAPPKYCAVNQHCNSAADCVSYVCSSSNLCVADITIPTGDMIDDFEDGNLLLTNTNGRVGNWYGYGDSTAGAAITPQPTPIMGQRGPTSLMGMDTTGGGFTQWGCGVGVDLSNSGGGQATKVPYNASFDDGSGHMVPYAGVTFWARSDMGTLSLTAVFPDGDTDAAGGICNTVENGVCDHHYLKSVSVGTDWKRYTVLFTDLALESGGYPTPTAFDPTRLVSVQFRINPGATFKFWVDDVAFVRP
jgi:hypothetical protein